MLSTEDITNATLQGRAELHRLVDALKRLGKPWKSLKIVATSSYIGVRESRRINGLYKITREDLIKGKTHYDSVCNVNFGVDVHSTDPAKGKGYNDSGKIKCKLPYQIPLRALQSADIKNLMMAGRCISGDFLAHSSYRVTGNAAPMGEYAGIASAVAAKGSLELADASWQEIVAVREKIALTD